MVHNRVGFFHQKPLAPFQPGLGHIPRLENRGLLYQKTGCKMEIKITALCLFVCLFVPLSRFCVGDKFFLKNNMILCQTDYEEGLMKEGYAPQVR